VQGRTIRSEGNPGRKSVSQQTKAAGLRITRLQLENWKNFQSLDLHFQQRVFLVGPNASGKSNLLDALRFLRDLATVGGGFQAAVQKRGGLKSIRCLAARRTPEVALAIEIGTDEEPNRWHYELRFNQGLAGGAAVEEVTKERVLRGDQVLLDRPSAEDKRDFARRSQTHLEQVTANLKFREIADFLNSIRYLHIVPQILREPERSPNRDKDPFGGDLLQQIALTRTNTQKARLRKIAKALQVAVPQLRELELWRDSRGAPHLRGKYEHWRPQGAWQTEEQLSDGTLRLLGLLWAILEGKGPLLLEEPELSLHPFVVRHLPQIFARMQKGNGRQVLLSTHSAEILQDEGIGLDEVMVLSPSREGTQVRPGAGIDGTRDLLEGGLENVGEAVFALTQPNRSFLLSSFEAH
jgi:predicted ATPase